MSVRRVEGWFCSECKAFHDKKPIEVAVWACERNHLHQSEAEAVECGNNSVKIETLGLSRRTLNCLAYDDIRYMDELLPMSPSQLLKIWNLGRTTLNEIEEALRSRGLSLAKERWMK